MHARLALRKRSPSPSWLFLQRNYSHRSHLGPVTQRRRIGASWSDMNANIMAILLLQKW
jgi:hypothetical protein